MSKRLRVAIDMSSVAKPYRSGVGNYAAELIAALIRQHEDTIVVTGHYYNFLGRQTLAALPQGPNMHYKVSRFLPEKVVNALRRFGIHLPFELFTKTRVDVQVFPNYIVQPSIFKVPTVFVVHDLAYLDLPETVSPKNRQDLTRFVPWSIRRSKTVITISEFTKQQIVQHYQVNENQINIVYPGIDPSHFFRRPKTEIEATRNQYKLPANYILFTGNLEPRKNITGVLEAYGQLDPTLRNKYALVLVGAKGWLDENIQNAITRQQAAGGNVHQLGYVDSLTLPSLYSGAALFVYPSFYEGFGIPLLEAMACGVPVIAGNNSSQVEVVGKAALLVDPESMGAIAKAISDILTDKKLSDTMAAKGLEQAKKFSWQKSADELAKIIGVSDEN